MESTIATATTGESKGSSGVYVYCIIECGEPRTFGPVPLASVLGRALFRYGPIGRIGWIW